MKRKSSIFVLCLVGIFSFFYGCFQQINAVQAKEDTPIVVMKNDYGEVSLLQTADQVQFNYRVLENTKGRRFLFQLYEVEDSERTFVGTLNEKSIAYVDTDNKKWFTTAFSKEMVEKEWTVSLPKDRKQLQLEIQVEEEPDQLLLPEAETFLLSLEPKIPESEQENAVKDIVTTESTTKETSTEVSKEVTTETSTKASITEETSTTQETSSTEEKESNDSSVFRPFDLPILASQSLPKTVLPLIAPTYTTNDTGTFPSAAWQPEGNQNVINHQGNVNGGEQWDGIESWDGNPKNKETSYIEYGGQKTNADYAIRKFAKETATPGLFDLYLNIRGNTQKQVTPLDVVLVVDWSGSMNEQGRIAEVKDGINRFVDTLEESGISDKINMGYVGYSSKGRGYTNGVLPLTSFDSIKEQFKTFTPSTTRGGTFTQQALRDAGDLLAEKNGHKKILVLLTDGVPTYSYHVESIQTEADGLNYGITFTGDVEGRGDTSHIWPYSVRDQDNHTQFNNSTFTATIGEAMALKERGIEIHGLGIQLQSDLTARLSKNEVEQRMRKMVSSSEEGTLYYESADQASDISDYLARQAIQLSGTVVNGKISDPIIDPFVYQTGSATVKSVGSLPVSIDPVLTVEGQTLNVDQIYLEKGQEIQLHYQVRIQTEDKTFQPEKWYQMNGKTTFQPTEDPEMIAEFGVPSAKAPGVSLSFTKEWEEFDHDVTNRPDQVIYEINRKNTTGANSWQTGYLKLTKPEGDAVDKWQRKEVTQLSEIATGNYQETLNLPAYNNQGGSFEYDAVKELPVSGYESEKVDSTTWRNKKQFIPLDLNVTKRSSSGNTLLKGAVFKVTGKDTDVTLVDHEDGTYSLPEDVRLAKGATYTLTEINAPKGHELSEKHTWKIVISEEGKVTIDEKAHSVSNQTIQLTIENPFSEIPIAIRKYTVQVGKEVNLKGATFALQRKDETGSYQTIEEQVTAESGLASFTVETAGDYRMVEVAGPAGYDTVPGNYEFQIDPYGEISYDGQNVDNTDVWTLTHRNHLKAFNLTVSKETEEGQSLKGASFTLKGEDVSIQLPEDETATDTFVFENLKPGTYTLEETDTPEGYQGLKEALTIVIKEDGTATVDNQPLEVKLVEGEKNNQLRLTVTNKAKIPLPETGGSGRLGFYFFGFNAVVSLLIYALLNKRGGVKE
ncbi:VWA domain-containing protein [Enterococcus hirae]|nr:VWA domain-containing protein [Enterococcus hirae]